MILYHEKIGVRPTVLIVDDEHALCVATQMILERHGFAVRMTHDGASTLQIFPQIGDTVAVVLLDIGLPDMNGIVLFHELRRMRPEVPIVLCSGDDPAWLELQFEGVNHSGILPKPYRSRGLLAAIRAALPMDHSSTSV